MLIIVLVNAVQQMSLELRLERFQRLIVPDLWWQPVPCQWCRHGKTTSSKIRRSWDDDEVAACGRSQSASGTDRWQAGRSLLDIVVLVQDHLKPCRLANKACTVSVVELAASEVDHAAHDGVQNEHNSHVKHGGARLTTLPDWSRN